MHIGLYFGSFNPIHIGHLIIANHILNSTELDKVWFVVSPQNPLKPSATLLNEYDRLYYVQKSTEGDERLKASDVEFSLKKPSYTIDTLSYLKQKYPEHCFSIIMGSDSFQNLPNWKSASHIISEYPIMIYKRPGFDVVNTLGANITILNAPLLDISATYIRGLVKKGLSIRYLVPSVIEEEIRENHFYKKG